MEELINCVMASASRIAFLEFEKQKHPPPLATKPNSLKSFSYTKTLTSFQIVDLFFVKMEKCLLLKIWKMKIFRCHLSNIYFVPQERAF